MMSSGDPEIKSRFGRGAYRLIQGVQFALNALTRVEEWSINKLGIISPPQSPHRGDQRGKNKEVVYRRAWEDRSSIVFLGD